MLRGMDKVEREAGLLALTYNLRKMYYKSRLSVFCEAKYAAAL